MANQPDDLDTLRSILVSLEPFDEASKERIIRWACEKLNIKNFVQLSGQQGGPLPIAGGSVNSIGPVQHGIKDIKTFLDEKSPTSANQLVAAVAYYHKFEASPTEKKNSIGADDLMEACRKSNRERPKFPGQILINASAYGLVDKVETGKYEINAVGENLVAVSMPTASHGNSGTKKTSAKSNKSSSRKK